MAEYDDYEDDTEEMIEAVAPTPLPDDGIIFKAGPQVLRAIENEVVANIANAIQNRVLREIDGKIKQIVDEAVRQVIGERAVEAVQSHLDKPRQKTDVWGNPSGPVASFAEIIPGVAEAYLNQMVNAEGRADNYSGNKATRVGWIIGKAVKDHIDPVVTKTVTDITNQAKMAISSKVGAFIAQELTPQIDAKAIEANMKGA